MKIAVLCIAVLAMLQTCLGLTVSMLRRKYKISSGCPDDPAHMLFRVRTAFNNCAEWHPILMILMVLLSFYAGEKWVIFLYPVVVTGRCFHVMGLVSAPITKPNMSRLLGATLTYLTCLVMAILLVKGVFLAT